MRCPSSPNQFSIGTQNPIYVNFTALPHPIGDTRFNNYSLLTLTHSIDLAQCNENSIYFLARQLEMSIMSWTVLCIFMRHTIYTQADVLWSFYSFAIVSQSSFPCLTPTHLLQQNMSDGSCWLRFRTGVKTL